MDGRLSTQKLEDLQVACDQRCGKTRGVEESYLSDLRLCLAKHVTPVIYLYLIRYRKTVFCQSIV
jgi:hypothetical protein